LFISHYVVLVVWIAKDLYDEAYCDLYFSFMLN